MMSSSSDAEHLGGDLGEHGVRPGPRSVAPTSRLNDPSSLILIEHAPMSTKGMPEPWMAQRASRSRAGCAGGPAGCFHDGSSRRSQPIARSPWATHSSRPQRRDVRQVLRCDLLDVAPLAEARHDVEGVADLAPSSCGGTRSGSMCQVRGRCRPSGTRAAKKRLRSPVAAEGARHGAVRVGDVAAEALGRAVVERQARACRQRSSP